MVEDLQDLKKSVGRKSENKINKRKRLETESEGSLSVSTGIATPARCPKKSRRSEVDPQDSQATEQNLTTLWIGDLERWEDEEQIFGFFQNLAPQGVVSVKIVRDGERRSRGYGFVDFSSKEVAERILGLASVIRRPHGRRFKLAWARGKTRQPFDPTNQRKKPPPNSEWFVAFNTSGQQQVFDNLIQPLGLAPGVTGMHVEPGAIGVTVYFETPDWFFSFVNRFPTGTVTLGAFSTTFEIPSVVMDRWVLLYNNSLKQPQSTS